MSTHITHSTCTIIPHTTPSEVSRAQPQIIIQILWNSLTLRTLVITLTPYRTIGPHVNLSYIANGTTANPLYSLISTFNVVTLVTHLSNNTCLLCQITQITNLLNSLCHRFLYEHSLALQHSISSDNSVGMVWSTDQYTIDFLTTVV